MNKEEKGKTLGEYQKKIKDLEERIAFMDADSSALAADLAHWKKVAAGLKGKVKQLTKQVEHYKALDKEGDEINEMRLKEIEEKDKVIRGLQEQVNNLTQKHNKMNNELDELRDEKQRLDDELKLAKTPWWKKIF